MTRRTSAALVLLLASACVESEDDDWTPPIASPIPTPEILMDPDAPDGGRLYVLVRSTAGVHAVVHAVQGGVPAATIALPDGTSSLDVDWTEGELALASTAGGVSFSAYGGYPDPAVFPGASDIVFTPRRYTCCGPQFIAFAAGESGVAGFSNDDGLAIQASFPWPGGASAVSVSPGGSYVAAALALSGTSAQIARLTVSYEDAWFEDVATTTLLTLDSCGGGALEAVAAAPSHVVAWDADCDVVHDHGPGGWTHHAVVSDGARTPLDHRALAVTRDGSSSIVLTTAGAWASAIGGSEPAAFLGATPGRPVAVAASYGHRAWIASQDGPAPRLSQIDLPGGSPTPIAAFDGGEGEVLDLVYQDVPPRVGIDNLVHTAGDAASMPVSLYDPDGDDVRFELTAPLNAVYDSAEQAVRYQSPCSKTNFELPIRGHAYSGKYRVTFESKIVLVGRKDCRTRASIDEVEGEEWACAVSGEPSASPGASVVVLLGSVLLGFGLRRARRESR